MAQPTEGRVWRRRLASAGAVLATGLVAYVVGVATAQTNNALERLGSAPESTCSTREGLAAPVEGREYMAVSVSDADTACWRPTIDSVGPEDTFQVSVQYQNFTDEQQDNVSLRVALPEGFRYVVGSTFIANSTTGGQWTRTLDGLTSRGYNAGSYQPLGNVFLKFQVVMTQDVGQLCNIRTWAVGAKLTSDATPDGMWSTAGVVAVRPPCT